MSSSSSTSPRPTEYVYKTVDGHAIRCDVWLPAPGSPSPSPAGAPALVFTRMSGFVAFSKDIAGAHWAHSGTSRGYVVVSLDHRLAPQAKVAAILDDILDACKWVREKLSGLCGVQIDPKKLVVAGGSAGAHLALLAGVHLEPKPLAVLSLYTLADPTAKGVNDKGAPNPPRGRDKLIEWEEVAAYMDEAGPVESHSRADDLDLATCTFKNRGAALMYLGQEGILWPKVYGSTDIEEVRKWSVPHLIRGRRTFPPCFLIHSRSDSFNPFTQSVAVASALEECALPHELWIVEDSENSVEIGGTGAQLEHNFDGDVMQAGERSGLEKAFAKRVWDDWLGPLIK